MIRLWRNAWEEFTPFLDYDPEIRTVLYAVETRPERVCEHVR
jgi:transposase-like protein